VAGPVGDEALGEIPLVVTFAEVGTDFPLFTGQVEFARSYAGLRTCLLCAGRGPCFALQRGTAVVVVCPGCAGSARVDVRRRSAACATCGRTAALREGLATDPVVLHSVYACADCLKAGRWVQSVVTERGVLAWQDDGIPAFDPPASPGDRAALAELLRTPLYDTWQGECWLFCHDRPMVFLGQWGREDFEHFRPGAGFEALAQLVPDACPSALWESGLGGLGRDGEAAVYVFRCARCDRLRAHSDCG